MALLFARLALSLPISRCSDLLLVDVDYANPHAHDRADTALRDARAHHLRQA